jgi:hypothetical protein
MAGSKSSKWIAITAGLGTSDFERAAVRVGKDLSSAAVVDQVVVITTEEIFETCPITTKIYSDLIKSQSRGFGFMSWKSELVNDAFAGKWGKYDGVIWIDAGCEVSMNSISKIFFHKYQDYAASNGVAAFTLRTPEIQYTKQDLFDEFPELDPLDCGDQIQSTWIFFHGEIGRKAARRWFETVCKGTHLLDLQPSKRPENPAFIENRYDQSSFSLVCKSLGIRPMNYKPTAGHGSFISRIKGFTHPIWTARNRTGRTKKIKVNLLLEKFL